MSVKDSHSMSFIKNTLHFTKRYIYQSGFQIAINK